MIREIDVMTPDGRVVHAYDGGGRTGSVAVFQHLPEDTSLRG